MIVLGLMVSIEDFYPEYRLVTYSTVETPRRRETTMHRIQSRAGLAEVWLY
jgi:hypothetical protein